MDQNAYIKAVVRKLKCSGTKKKEIAKQLRSDIGIALEEGRTMDQIFSEMGSASQLAEEFNENMPKEELKKAKRSFVLKMAAAAVIFLALLGGLLYWWIPKQKSMEDSTRFEEDTVISQVETIITLLNEEDYDTLQRSYITQEMETYVTKEYIDEAKARIDQDWGGFVSFGTSYMAEVSQMNENYAVTQINVAYENTSVLFTITLDEDLMLAGLFMR